MGHSLFNSDWENVVDQDRNNLVFESRNQAYGAYVIRREYDRAVIFALLLSSSLMLGSVLTPVLIKYFSPSIDEPVEISREVVIIPVEPIDKTQVKVTIPERPAAVMPVTSSIAWTIPEVTDEKIEPGPIADQSVENPGITTNTSNLNEGEDLKIPDGQNSNTGSLIDEKDDKPFIYVDQMPEFPGGYEAMMRFIGDNLHFPEFEKVNGISGTVYISFVINREGNVSLINVERGIKGGKAFEEEAQRVLRMMPQWKPGKNNGYPVSVMFTLPVAFELRR